MKTEIFVLCDFAQDNGGKLSLMGAFDTLVARQLPVLHPFMCVATRLRFAVYELGKHALRIEFRDPEDLLLIPPFDNNVKLENISDDSGVTGIILQLAQVKFEKFGKHRVKLLVDGNELAEAPLYVRKATQEMSAL